MRTFLKKRSGSASGLYLPAALLLAMLSTKVSGQILWSSPTTGTWQTTTNWTGGVVPTSTDVAQIGLNPTGTSIIGIDMGAATNNGTGNQAVGAIEMTSARTNNLTIGNNAAAASGTLSFTSATVNAVPNVIIRNNSGSNLTVSNTSLSIALNSTVNNKIIQDGTGKITIACPITGAANAPLTIDGVGAGTEVDITNTANTFAGPLILNSTETVFSGEGSFGAVPGTVNPSAITINGGRMTMNATYTLNANRGIKLGNTPGTSISVKTGASFITYNGIMADLTTGGMLVKQGGNLLQLGGVSIYTGPTGVNNGTIALIGGNNRLPVTTTLNMGQALSSNTGTFDLNGFNQQIAGLSSITGTNASASTKNNITSSTASTLTINATGNFTYGAGTTQNSGLITGGVSIVKNGSGIQVLGDVNTYTGSTTINAGELRFSAPNNESLSSSAVTLNGGTLGTSGITGNRSVTFSTLNLTDNSIINLDNVNTHTLYFASSSGVTWTAAKTLTITGWQGNYTNATSGNLGRIFVGSTASDLTASQLSKILFYNGTGYFAATLLASGELVPLCTTPSITAVNGNSVACAGGTINLTASATGTLSPTFLWNGPNSYTSSVQNPTLSNVTASISGIYTVSAINSCGTATATTSITVNALPTVSANTTSTVICTSQSVSITGGGASTYTINATTGTAISGVPFTPTATATYTVRGTDANNCVNSAVTTISVNVTPTLSVNAATICSGATATLTANGATTYSWSTSATTASVAVNPTGTSNYTITGFNPGCSSSLTTAVTVYSVPALSVNAPTICAGATATLTANGAASYTWNTNSNASSITVTPASTNVYTITGASSQSCVSTATTQVTVNLLPTVTSLTTSVCSGGTATLTASGTATSYVWFDGTSNVSTTSVVVSPTSNAIYTITGTSAQGCVTTATTGVFVTSSPSINVNSPTICVGGTATLTATGVGTFTWSNGANTPTIMVTPSTNTVYTVSGNASGCVVTASNTSTVTVNANPTVVVNSATICSGTTATLIASGAATYSWSNSSTSATINPSPSTTQTYTVVGTSSLNCINTVTTQVTVNATPTVVVNSATICTGNTATLTANGATTYSWSTSSTASFVTVNPAANANYTVTGTSTANCSSSKIATVTVNGLPTVTVNSPTICAGVSATLTAGGANTYSWSTTATTASISVNPSSSTVYTVTGTSSLSCISTATTQVTVNSLPTLTANPVSICAGATATVAASGAATYSWSNNNTTSSFTVTPALSTNYTVTGTSTSGCSSSKTLAVTVNTNPAVAATSASICPGNTATLTASGASTYTWNTASTTASITASPASSTSYTVTGTSVQGCVKTATTMITVFSSPTLVANSASICAGNAATLSVSGASSYSWNTGTTSSSFTVSPTSNTSYTVTGTSTQGCSSSSVVVVTVNALPAVSFGTIPAQLCVSDNNVTLASSPAGGTYSGTGISSGAFTPSVAGIGTYTLTYRFTDANNCSASDSKVVTVDLCTGIKANTANTSIHVSPNPAHGEITIRNASFTTDYELSIYDVAGKQVYSTRSSQELNTVDLNSLDNGLYILRITENNQQSTLKFIKN